MMVKSEKRFLRYKTQSRNNYATANLAPVKMWVAVFPTFIPYLFYLSLWSGTCT